MGRLLYLSSARTTMEVLQCRLARRRKERVKMVVCQTVIKLFCILLLLSGISSSTVGLAHSSLSLIASYLCLCSDLENSSLFLAPSTLLLNVGFFSLSHLQYWVTPKTQTNPNCTAVTKGKLQFYYYNPEVCDFVMEVIVLGPM